MLLVANFANTKKCKNPKNYWNHGKWVLIWEYSARAFKWIPRRQGFNGFSKILHSCALDESILSIGRVKGDISVHVDAFRKWEYQTLCKCELQYVGPLGSWSNPFSLQSYSQDRYEIWWSESFISTGIMKLWSKGPFLDSPIVGEST